MINPFVYWLATSVTHFILLPLYARIRVTGLENMPLTGPLIIASNHLNDADPGIITTRINRKMAFMTKVELFKVPGVSHFLRAFGAFPVRRHEADLGALRHASEVLNAGLALCIFPEGTRAGPAEKLREAWPGTALVALRSGAPVLPVAITGSGKLRLPRMFLRPFRRYDVTLTVGEPFYLPRPGRINAEAAQAGSRLIMEKIAALLPEEHRGFYAASAATEPAPSGRV